MRRQAHHLQLLDVQRSRGGPDGPVCNYLIPWEERAGGIPHPPRLLVEGGIYLNIILEPHDHMAARDCRGRRGHRPVDLRRVAWPEFAHPATHHVVLGPLIRHVHEPFVRTFPADHILRGHQLTRRITSDAEQDGARRARSDGYVTVLGVVVVEGPAGLPIHLDDALWVDVPGRTDLVGGPVGNHFPGPVPRPPCHGGGGAYDSTSTFELAPMDPASRQL